MFDRTDIDRIREMTDLAALIGEHVVLTARGHEHVGLCPFHDDKNPSFAVVTHKGNHFYKCHSCGESGDCYTFVQKFLQQDFTEAVTFLAERAGYQLERVTGANRTQSDRKAWLRRAARAAQEFFRETLQGEKGELARRTIEQRNIAPEMVDRFELGAAPAGWENLRQAIMAPDLPEKVLVAAGLLKERSEGTGSYDAFRNRLIFPIHDDSGNPIAFGARAMDDDDQPKYLNSSEHDLFHKGQTLYGMHLARPTIVRTRQAIVTEGYTDVIACHAAGFENVIGTLGTALTDDHVRRLSRLCDTIVLVFDGDEAGQKAAERAIRIVFRHPVDVKICVLDDGQDPDDLLRQADGNDRFQASIESASDTLDYLVARFRGRLDDAEGLSARQRTLEQFIDMLRGLGLDEAEPMRRSMLVNRIAELTGVAARDIESRLRRPSGPATPETNVEAVPETASGARQIAERDILAVVLYRTESVSEAGLSPRDALGGDRFLDTAHRILADTLRDLLQSNPPTMQAVLGRLEDENHRELASRLYFIGERLVSDSAEDGGEHPLRRAITALEDCVQEHELQRDLADWKNRDATDDRTAADVIRNLGSRKRRPSAILRTGERD
ncbi:MAG: DNA primase [Phycisphaerales bacterium]|nr:DNA primase [Phycisphaerales bacterium]